MSAPQRCAPTLNAPSLEVAETRLPIDLDGREIILKSFAFKAAGIADEVIILVHRSDETTAPAVPLVRVHSGCVTGDIFHSLRCDCYQQLQAALHMICQSPFGAIVYAPSHEGRGIGLFKKIQAYALQERGADTVDANLAIGVPVDTRDYALASRALLHLGMGRIKLLSNNPQKQAKLAEHGMEIAERIALRIPANPHNQRYLDTKRSRLNHDC